MCGINSGVVLVVFYCGEGDDGCGTGVVGGVEVRR